jgi:hypothetical protein
MVAAVCCSLALLFDARAPILGAVGVEAATSLFTFLGSNPRKATVGFVSTVVIVEENSLPEKGRGAEGRLFVC